MASDRLASQATAQGALPPRRTASTTTEATRRPSTHHTVRSRLRAVLRPIRLAVRAVDRDEGPPAGREAVDKIGWYCLYVAQIPAEDLHVTFERILKRPE